MLGLLATLAATLTALPDSGPALAQPDDELPLDLAWRAPEACPDVASARAEIYRRVGQISGERRRTRVAAEVEIRGSGTTSFEMSLRTRVGETTGERDLTGADCRQLAQAAALVLALLINPDADLAETPPAPAPPPPPAPPLTGAAVDAALDPALAARFAVGADGTVAAGVLPGAAFGLSARLSYMRGPLEVALRAGGYFPKTQGAAGFPGASASFYRLESALALCARTSPGRRMSATVCLGGAAVRLHGESGGVSSPGAATAYWPEAFAEAGAYIRITRRARLRIGAEARGLGRRPDFAILGLGSVYRPSTTSLRGSLGVDMLF